MDGRFVVCLDDLICEVQNRCSSQNGLDLPEGEDPEKIQLGEHRICIDRRINRTLSFASPDRQPMCA